MQCVALVARGPQHRFVTAKRDVEQEVQAGYTPHCCGMGRPSGPNRAYAWAQLTLLSNGVTGAACEESNSQDRGPAEGH